MAKILKLVQNWKSYCENDSSPFCSSLCISYTGQRRRDCIDLRRRARPFNFGETKLWESLDSRYKYFICHDVLSWVLNLGQLSCMVGRCSRLAGGRDSFKFARVVQHNAALSIGSSIKYVPFCWQSYSLFLTSMTHCWHSQIIPSMMHITP